MWQSVFDRMIKRLIVKGELRVTFPDGHSRFYGDGSSPQSAVRISDDATLRALCLRPDLALGETYVNGTLIIENDDIDTLVRLIMHNRFKPWAPVWVRALNDLRFRFGRFIQQNTPERARRNVAHHYDLSNDLYRLFLDEDMQYSCAYFPDPGMSLEDAQAAKKAHIATKLRIEPGMRVLDIGCGWGGMAITLARDWGANVVGVTLSENQLALARERVAAAGLEGQVDLRLMDYRLLDEPFDRIVSVGMLEHVGLPHYDDYFAKVFSLLAPQGVALIHTIGRHGKPEAISRWIEKYIFPGSYIPTLGEIGASVDRNDFWVCDVESLRLHYSMTLRHWRDRFIEQRHQLGVMGFDERFFRMYNFYLASMIASFRDGNLLVYQYQLSKAIDAVPITRDYLYGNMMHLDASRTRAAE